MIDTRTYIEIDGWTGRQKYSVVVVGETPKKYRVKLLVDTKLPGRNRWGNAGEVILVPKSVVKQDSQ